MTLLFCWCPGACHLSFFEVEPQSQRKKIKGPAIHIPCQGDAMNEHKGFYTPLSVFCVTTVMLA